MELSYYPSRGLAQQIRTLAFYLGFDLKETRYENAEDWFQKDKKNINMLFPNLPFLADGDFKLSESNAIMFYLCIKAEKEEMLGKAKKDEIIMAQIIGVAWDCAIPLIVTAYSTDDITQFEKLFNDKILNKLGDLNKFFENREYVTGDYLTYADFIVNERLMMANAFALKVLKENLFEKFVNLKKYHENFMNIPKIKEFFGKKEFDLPFAQNYAKFLI